MEEKPVNPQITDLCALAIRISYFSQILNLGPEAREQILDEHQIIASRLASDDLPLANRYVTYWHSVKAVLDQWFNTKHGLPYITETCVAIREGLVGMAAGLEYGLSLRK